MVAGVNGVHLDPVHAHVEVASSCLRGSVTIPFHQMGVNTVSAFGSNIAPAT